MSRATSGPLLQVVAVGKTHGTGARAVQVLSDVSLQVEPGELVALSGRSGSGKSTLCHLVAGVGRPTTGQVLLDGCAAHDVQDWATVAFLPQRLGLVAELSVADNVQLPARLRGRQPDTRDDLLDALALAPVADRASGQTSLGEQQRTALARALVLRPALAVLDEPTGHQDDHNVALVLEALRRARDEGTATLVATHDARVLAAADRVVALHGGRVVPGG